MYLLLNEKNVRPNLLELFVMYLQFNSGRFVVTLHVK